MNKKLKSLLALLMGVTVSAGVVACGDSGKKDDGKVTYRTTTSTMPSNWNEFTYADNNDTQILSYISSSFFEYDYLFDEAKGGKFNADGSINKAAIVEGGYSTNYSAATKLEDVTKDVEAKWGYSEAQKTEGGYAWKITLRDDLKWDDGTSIDADDFIYSMKEILNPDFLNLRADTYCDTLKIKKAKAYFNKNQDATYPTVGSQGYASNQAAIDAGETLYVDAFSFYNANGYVDAEGNKCPQWVAINDETVYNSVEAWADPDNADIQDAFSGKDLWDYFFAPDAPYGYGPYVEVGADYESWISIKVENTEKDVVWDQVGMYKVDETSFVVCLDKSYQFLKDDGSLSYLAAYYMSALPLVKQSLYDDCKIEPVEGATLWTSNYNSSLETTASWGPYKLVSFQSGKSYKLEKNEYWYGYNMAENKNQYNVDAIYCECIKEPATAWMMFLGGDVDEGALTSENIADYMNSKYTTWSPGTGTFGMQLFGDLDVLKASDNNNGILAIDEFRQAFSLALNRTDVVEKIWPGSAIACFGLLNDQYYSNIEEGEVYRNTVQAKEGILRAYGFTQAEDGTWSNGSTINGATLDAAYRALTGYDPVLAKEKVKAAYEELVANADKYGYDASKEIVLKYGTSAKNAKQEQRVAYLQNVLDTLTAGTGLEGKIKVVLSEDGADWDDKFRNGDSQIGFGYGFSGNAFNPFDMVGAFVDPKDELNYHTYWDTTKEKLTLTLPAGDYDGAGQTITMDLRNWFLCLNGLAAEEEQTYQYNWDAGKAPSEVRLTILAALEEKVIEKSYSVMLIGDYSGSLLGAKFSQFDDYYNTFMGHGGIRYMVVNYTDAQWTNYVKSHNNDLSNEYKKAE